jgi:hypothetical protein
VKKPKSQEAWDSYFDSNQATIMRHAPDLAVPSKYPEGMVARFEVNGIQEAISEAVLLLVEGENPRDIPLVRSILNLQKVHPILIFDGAPDFPSSNQAIVRANFQKNLPFRSRERNGPISNTFAFHGDGTGLPFLLQSSTLGRREGTLYTTREKAFQVQYNALYPTPTHHPDAYLPENYKRVFGKHLQHFATKVKNLDRLKLTTLYDKILCPAAALDYEVTGKYGYIRWLKHCMRITMAESKWHPDFFVETAQDAACVHFPSATLLERRWVCSASNLLHCLDGRKADDAKNLSEELFPEWGALERLQVVRPRA